MNAWPFRVSIHMCTFVSESHSSEASLTSGTFVFICATQPDYYENCFIRFFFYLLITALCYCNVQVLYFLFALTTQDCKKNVK